MRMRKWNWGKDMSTDREVELYIHEIQAVKGVISRMTQGDLDHRLNPNDFQQFADLAGDINGISTILNDYVNEISHVLSHLSAGNMAVSFSEGIHFRGDFRPVKNALRKIKRSLNQSFQEIRQLSYEIDQMTGRVESGSSLIAADSVRQMELIGQLTDTISEIAGQTDANAADASEAAGNAGKIRKETETGRIYMDQMMESIQRVSDSSRDISSIIEILKGLARQTKLLSLNAAIEAARAGDEGRGFSVVAEEVGNLASQSELAVRRTTELINKSIQSSRDCAEVAEKTAASFALIQSSIEALAGLCGNIAGSCADQAQKINQTSSIITNIYEVSQSYAAYAQTNSANALLLAEMSASLKEVLKRYLLADQAVANVNRDIKEDLGKPLMDRMAELLKTAESPEEMNLILEREMAACKDVECMYVIGEDGKQITRTILNPHIITEQDENFQPALPGDDHGDKKYFRQAIKYPEELYCSYEYISTATGGLCRTLSLLCRGANDKSFVICIDLICNFR